MSKEVQGRGSQLHLLKPLKESSFKWPFLAISHKPFVCHYFRLGSAVHKIMQYKMSSTNQLVPCVVSWRASDFGGVILSKLPAMMLMWMPLKMAIPVLGLCLPSPMEEASVLQSPDLLAISGVCSLKPSIENAIHTNCGGCLRCLRIGKVTWLPQNVLFVVTS